MQLAPRIVDFTTSRRLSADLAWTSVGPFVYFPPLFCARFLKSFSSFEMVVVVAYTKKKKLLTLSALSILA